MRIVGRMLDTSTPNRSLSSFTDSFTDSSTRVRVRRAPAPEWVGGLLHPPRADGTPDRLAPPLAVWMDVASGAIVAAEIANGTQCGAHAAREALTRGLLTNGLPPGVLPRLRVADANVAAELAHVWPVVLAPTPELDEVDRALRDVSSKLYEESIDPFRCTERAALERFFDRAAQFVHLRPWDTLPLDTPIALDLPRLEMFGACAFLWKREGKRGVVILRSFEAWETFIACTERCEREGRDDGPGAPYVSVDFYSDDELQPSVVRRVERAALRLADRESIPIPAVVEADGNEPDLTDADLDLCGSVLRAIGDTLFDHRDTLACGEPVQALVEIDDRDVALVEVPHPEWG